MFFLFSLTYFNSDAMLFSSREISQVHLQKKKKKYRVFNR